jgi:hypothetical protein
MRGLLRGGQIALHYLKEYAMSDGCEQRRDEDERRQWEKEKDHEDQIDRYPADPRQPERRES